MCMAEDTEEKITKVRELAYRRDTLAGQLLLLDPTISEYDVRKEQIQDELKLINRQMAEAQRAADVEAINSDERIRDDQLRQSKIR